MALTKIRQEQGVVINEGSTDVDFRVESNGNANMLFVDGGNDKIGINTGSPDAMLTVDTNVGGSSTGTLARFHSSKGESDSTYLQIAATRHGTASVQRVQLQAFDDDGSTGRTLALNPSGGNIGIATNTPEDLLHLQGGGANDSVGAPIIRLQKTSGGAVDDGQTIGGMSFWVNDDGVDSGAPKERAKIIAESQNTSSAARLEFWTGNSNAAIAIDAPDNIS